MVLTKLTTGIVIASDSGGVRGGDQATDRVPGVARVLAELGADPKIIADALRERPDLTAEQVRETWAYYQERIAQSDGKLNEGVFFHAIRRGQIHAAPPDPAQPIPVESYADDPGFKLGSDVSPPGEGESIGDRARRILPVSASTADWVFVQTQLARGDSDDGALAALAARRSAVKR